jgi:hypothetical protein
MSGKIVVTNRAARMSASVFGVLAGLGGMTHGVGEVLQGNVAPSGVVFNSWAEGPIAATMGGEPAMSIVPNLLLTGALTIVVALAVVVFSALFVQRKNGGAILILLSIAMLLVGGGFAPPILGILAGAAGTGIRAPYTWWRAHLPGGMRRFMARLWPWIFGICAANGIFLVAGSVILVYALGLNNPALFTNSFLLAVLLMVLTIISGVGYDIEERK